MKKCRFIVDPKLALLMQRLFTGEDVSDEFAKLKECGKPATERVNGYYFCSEHYTEHRASYAGN
jgi:hypothetical protein